MAVFFRLAILGLFAAAGVGLAISFAVHGASLSSMDNGSTRQAATAAADSPRLPVQVPSPSAPGQPSAGEPSSRSTPGTMALSQQEFAIPDPPRWQAAYGPAVASSFEELQEAIRKIQDGQQRTAEAVTRLQEELPRPQPAEASTHAGAPVVVNGEPRPQIRANEGDQNLTIDLQNSDIREVLRLLSEAGGLNILASQNVTGTVSASLSGVDAATALEAILRTTGYTSQRDGNFVIVGTPKDLQTMLQSRERVSTRVYRPNYVAADELQNLLTPLLSPEIGKIVVSRPAEVGIRSNATEAGGDSFAGSEVLLVRDYQRVLDHMDQIVTEVDKKPRQVIIEAMILSVKLDDKNRFGVDFELLRNKEHIRIVSGTALDSLVAASLNEGLKVGFLDSSTFVFLNALETIGDTNVIATPRVMCLNKQRAEILIGSELGYLSTTVTETAATQSVEFLKVGTHLAIRPFISADGMIRMEVHPELSTGAVRVEGGFTLPDKDVTQVTTNIMCPTGRTVVLGGLIREDLSTNGNQIPVLGNLPLVGALFRDRTEEIDRHEIIVLLTPRIIDEPEMGAEGEQAAHEYLERREVFADKMNPLGKRQYGERYSRQASAAWAAGDGSAALRYVNLAIHFDPLNAYAVQLRSEILASCPQLERGVHAQLRYGLAPWQHPLRDYSRQGWPAHTPGSIQAPRGDQPLRYDEGQPGEIHDVVVHIESP